MASSTATCSPPSRSIPPAPGYDGATHTAAPTVLQVHWPDSPFFQCCSLCGAFSALVSTPSAFCCRFVQVFSRCREERQGFTWWMWLFSDGGCGSGGVQNQHQCSKLCEYMCNNHFCCPVSQIWLPALAYSLCLVQAPEASGACVNFAEKLHCGQRGSQPHCLNFTLSLVSSWKIQAPAVD